MGSRVLRQPTGLVKGRFASQGDGARARGHFDADQDLFDFEHNADGRAVGGLPSR